MCVCAGILVLTPSVIAETPLCCSSSTPPQHIVMLRALLPSAASRLACLTTPSPSSTLTAVGLGHQTELRRTFSQDGSRFIRGTSHLGPSFLHHSSPSLTHWRGKRSFVRRRELEKMGTKGGARPWLPEEDQVKISSWLCSCFPLPSSLEKFA